MSQQINLYNPALGPQRTWLSARNLALATGVALAVVLVAGGIANSRLSTRKIEAQQAGAQVKQIQERAQKLAQQVANAKPDPALQVELDKLSAQVESRALVLSVLSKGLNTPGNGYSEMLRGLARQTLSGLWLTDINIAANGGELELKGRTLDRSLVAEYLNRLNSEKVFTGRSFAGLHIAQAKPEGVVPGSSVRPVPYLEFSLSGSKDNIPAGEEKTGTSITPDGKEKKS